MIKNLSLRRIENMCKSTRIACK